VQRANNWGCRFADPAAPFTAVEASGWPTVANLLLLKNQKFFNRSAGIFKLQLKPAPACATFLLWPQDSVWGCRFADPAAPFTTVEASGCPQSQLVGKRPARYLKPFRAVRADGCHRLSHYYSRTITREDGPWLRSQKATPSGRPVELRGRKQNKNSSTSRVRHHLRAPLEGS
jgi:hypothetical protein